jgi:hypothetical protein
MIGSASLTFSANARDGSTIRPASNLGAGDLIITRGETSRCRQFARKRRQRNAERQTEAKEGAKEDPDPEATSLKNTGIKNDLIVDISCRFFNLLLKERDRGL